MKLYTFGRQTGLMLLKSNGFDISNIGEDVKEFNFSFDELNKFKRVVINREILKKLDYFNHFDYICFCNDYFSTDEVNKVLFKFKDVKDLIVDNVKTLEGFDLSNNEDLDFLYISDNKNLLNIKGLDKARNCKYFVFFNNIRFINEDKVIDIMKDIFQKGNTIRPDILFCDKFRKEISSCKDDRLSFLECIGGRRPKYFTTPSNAKQMLQVIDHINKHFIKEGDNQMQKVACVSRWFQTMVAYDFETLNYEKKNNRLNVFIHNTEGALLNRKSVCEGIGKAYSLVLKTNDINAFPMYIDVDKSLIDYDEYRELHKEYPVLGGHVIVKGEADGTVFDYDITRAINRYRYGRPDQFFITDDDVRRQGFIFFEYMSKGMKPVEENEKISLQNYSMKVLCEYHEEIFFKSLSPLLKPFDFLRTEFDKKFNARLNKDFKVIDSMFSRESEFEKDLYRGINERVNYLICNFDPEMQKKGGYGRGKSFIYTKTIERVCEMVEKYKRTLDSDIDVWKLIEKDIKDSRNPKYDYGKTIENQIEFIKECDRRLNMMERVNDFLKI